jgi:hypothetical protein
MTRVNAKIRFYKKRAHKERLKIRDKLGKQRICLLFSFQTSYYFFAGGSLIRLWRGIASIERMGPAFPEGCKKILDKKDTFSCSKFCRNITGIPFKTQSLRQRFLQASGFPKQQSGLQEEKRPYRKQVIFSALQTGTIFRGSLKKHTVCHL